jgi:hypothetical protein
MERLAVRFRFLVKSMRVVRAAINIENKNSRDDYSTARAYSSREKNRSAAL